VKPDRSFKISVMSSEGIKEINASLVSVSCIPSFYNIRDVKTGKLYTVHRQRIPTNERNKKTKAG
jgi:hypothetical protein